MLSNSLHCKLTLIDSSFSMVYLKVRCILHIVKESWSPLDLVHPSCRYSMSQCIYVCLFFLPKLSAKNLILNPYIIVLDLV